MKNLWAPWRLKYVRKSDDNKNDECIFCSKFSSTNDKKNFVVKRGEYSFILFNIYPYNNGHLMVAPKRHIADIVDLLPEERKEFFDFILNIKQVLTKVLNPDGFNLGMNCGSAAGAGIADHIHMHIVPRWRGDTNFMASVAELRVIPQSLEALYSEIMEII